jgi:hypothetical protein
MASCSICCARRARDAAARRARAADAARAAASDDRVCVVDFPLLAAADFAGVAGLVVVVFGAAGLVAWVWAEGTTTNTTMTAVTSDTTDRPMFFTIRS